MVEKIIRYLINLLYTDVPENIHSSSLKGMFGFEPLV